MANTSALTQGTVVSGVKADRDNTSFPDDEQERRLQARQEFDWSNGKRPTHPSFTKDPQTVDVQVAKQNAKNDK